MISVGTIVAILLGIGLFILVIFLVWIVLAKTKTTTKTIRDNTSSNTSSNTSRNTVSTTRGLTSTPESCQVDTDCSQYPNWTCDKTSKTCMPSDPCPMGRCVISDTCTTPPCPCETNNAAGQVTCILYGNPGDIQSKGFDKMSNGTTLNGDHTWADGTNPPYITIPSGCTSSTASFCRDSNGKCLEKCTFVKPDTWLAGVGTGLVSFTFTPSLYETSH